MVAKRGAVIHVGEAGQRFVSGLGLTDPYDFIAVFTQYGDGILPGRERADHRNPDVVKGQQLAVEILALRVDPGGIEDRLDDPELVRAGVCHRDPEVEHLNFAARQHRGLRLDNMEIGDAKLSGSKIDRTTAAFAA
jgi:hypothetical protein